MHLRFTISEENFLSFQLYTLSKSDKVRKKMKRGQFFASILGLILSFNLFISDAFWPGIIMTVLCIVIYFYYPTYHKWRMKRNFKMYIRRNYHDRFGQEEELTFMRNGVLSKNISGEGEIAKKELLDCIELSDLLLLRMKNGASLLLPKHQLSDLTPVKAEIKKLGLPIHAELDWKY